jgi:hypothetical protein
VWHGENDTTVRPSAGEELARQWVHLHGLEGGGKPSREGAHTRLLWHGTDGSVRVEHHRIGGMGHGAPLKTAGPDGCGAAGPFLLEVGVSSAHEIARSWGLTERRMTLAKPTETVETAAAPPLAPRFGRGQRSPRPSRPGIGEVIEKALRAAGLVK